MRIYCLRLVNGDDLKEKIEGFCKEKGLDTVVILSSVGCIKHFKVRLAKAIDYLEIADHFEIIALNGTISNGEAHLHIGVSDDKGHCLGGHLMKGCIIDTTCELVLGELKGYNSIREYDEKTGYDEIVFKEVQDE